jgi:hypothetical protein
MAIIKNGKIELWTVIPIAFLFSLLLLRLDYDFINMLIIQGVTSSMIGIVYLGDYAYKKIRRYDGNTNTKDR